MQTMTHVETATETVPLVVDLDGTLLRTDSLWESLVLLAKDRWYAVFLLPLWLFRGKAYFKWRLAQAVDLSAANLPYNESFLAFLKKERERSRSMILATAANEKIAQSIAAHLGLFDQVLASDRTVNLSGKNKLAKIQVALRGQPFDYAGNEKADLSIWSCARRALLVNPTRSAMNGAPRLKRVEKVFVERKLDVAVYLQALRLYQWPKNLLIFLPILTAHLVTERNVIAQSLLGFLSWCLCASTVYVLNDLWDLTSDRQHPKKRARSLASGAMPLSHGIALVPILLIVSSGLTLLLPPRFAVILAVYFFVAIAYSAVIKKIMLVDVTTIAGLYTLRVIGGAEAIGITPTFWLLAFSMFLFLHLALVKRYADLVVLQTYGKLGADGRDYKITDLPALISFGASAGYLAVLVLALYINSIEIQVLYSHPKVVWFLCPLLLYWNSRMWMKSVRGEMHHDPLVYALKDRASWIVAACALAVLGIAV